MAFERGESAFFSPRQCFFIKYYTFYILIIGFKIGFYNRKFFGKKKEKDHT